MFNLLLLAPFTATLLALSAAASYVLPVDKLQAIKISLHGYGASDLCHVEQEPDLPDAHFQSVVFSVPFPNSPWGANESEYLQLKLGVGKCATCFDVGFEGTKPEPYPKHLYHSYAQDSSDSIHVAEITISDFPDGTTASDRTGDLHFTIPSVDDQLLDKPLAFIVTWNFDKPNQRLGRLVYEPASQVIEFAEVKEFPGYPLVPPMPPNRICEQARELKLLGHDNVTQYTSFAVICEGCFRSTYNAPDSLIFSLEPQPQTKPDEFEFELNGIPQSIMYKGWCHTRDGGCRLRVEAPDAFNVMHTIDIMSNGHRTVVEEDYSELGSISASEEFTVRFWIYSIDGKPPPQHVSFTGRWDLLHKAKKRTPRWQSLVLEPTAIWFPWTGERVDAKDASDTLKPQARVGWTGPRTPLISSFQTMQGSSLALKALLILVGYLAGSATSSRFRRRR
ncbi:hypothetical protein PV04_05444 [Phialophora macrospora]|uniref:Chitin-binding type-4 domain-containing protein n=1 Tax=Phialophora macrospora TaxID=1851006 RepID=A0A0D2GBZ0_9EURO|nr:hypothetical protein PV04_05444 [Phialophora macrospora]